jgi:hypothetical protein
MRNARSEHERSLFFAQIDALVSPSI